MVPLSPSAGKWVPTQHSEPDIFCCLIQSFLAHRKWWISQSWLTHWVYFKKNQFIKLTPSSKSPPSSSFPLVRQLQVSAVVWPEVKTTGKQAPKQYQSTSFWQPEYLSGYQILKQLFTPEQYQHFHSRKQWTVAQHASPMEQIFWYFDKN